MTESLTALRVKQYVEEFLADQLGTYTTSDGYSYHAVSVGNPPDNVTAEGIEVIVPLFPDVEGKWNDTYVHRKDTWDLLVVQRSGYNLPEAVSRLMASRFIHPRGVYVPQNDTVGSYPMYRLTFTYFDSLSLI